jgi:hypothetical protein
VKEFFLTYELKGAQKGIDVLSRYYGIKRMKIVVDGRKAGKANDALYDECVAYFKKNGLNRGNVLHEFYHHLAYILDWNMSDKREEREANQFALTFETQLHRVYVRNSSMSFNHL